MLCRIADMPRDDTISSYVLSPSYNILVRLRITSMQDLFSELLATNLNTDNPTPVARLEKTEPAAWGVRKQSRPRTNPVRS